MAEPTAPDAANLAGHALSEPGFVPRSSPTWVESFRLWLERLDARIFGPPHTFQEILALVIVRLESDLPAEDNSSHPTGYGSH